MSLDLDAVSLNSSPEWNRLDRAEQRVQSISAGWLTLVGATGFVSLGRYASAQSLRSIVSWAIAGGFSGIAGGSYLRLRAASAYDNYVGERRVGASRGEGHSQRPATDLFIPFAGQFAAIALQLLALTRVHSSVLHSVGLLGSVACSSMFFYRYGVSPSRPEIVCNRCQREGAPEEVIQRVRQFYDQFFPDQLNEVLHPTEPCGMTEREYYCLLDRGGYEKLETASCSHSINVAVSQKLARLDRKIAWGKICTFGVVNLFAYNLCAGYGVRSAFGWSALWLSAMGFGRSSIFAASWWLHKHRHVGASLTDESLSPSDLVGYESRWRRPLFLHSLFLGCQLLTFACWPNGYLSAASILGSCWAFGRHCFWVGIASEAYRGLCKAPRGEEGGFRCFEPTQDLMLFRKCIGGRQVLREGKGLRRAIDQYPRGVCASLTLLEKDARQAVFADPKPDMVIGTGVDAAQWLSHATGFHRLWEALGQPDKTDPRYGQLGLLWGLTRAIQKRRDERIRPTTTPSIREKYFDQMFQFGSPTPTISFCVEDESARVVREHLRKHISFLAEVSKDRPDSRPLSWEIEHRYPPGKFVERFLTEPDPVAAMRSWAQPIAVALDLAE